MYFYYGLNGDAVISPAASKAVPIAERRAAIKFGIAIAALMPGIVTIISSSINEKPFNFIAVILPIIQIIRKRRETSGNAFLLLDHLRDENYVSC